MSLSRPRLVAAAALMVAACSPARGPAPVREHMVSHYDLATDLRAAALRGDLAGVRRAAAGLAAPDELMTMEWSLFVSVVLRVSIL